MQGLQDPVAVRIVHLRHDPPVAQEEHGVRPGRRLSLVSHHDDALVEVIDAGAQDPQDLLGRPRVEVPGRLVGEDDRGAAHDGAGAGRALDLAAGELGGPVGQAVRQTDRLDDLVEAAALDLPTGDVQGQGDVLPGRQGGNQVEGLEHEADALAPQPGQAPLAHGGDLLPVQGDRPGGGGLQARQAVHEGRLARPRGPHDRGETGARDGDVHPVQRGHGVLAAPEDLEQGARGDDRVIDRAVLGQTGAPPVAPPSRVGSPAVPCGEVVTTILRVPGHDGSLSQARP